MIRISVPLHGSVLIIANVAQRTFEIVQKSGSREHGDIINYMIVDPNHVPFVMTSFSERASPKIV